MLACTTPPAGGHIQLAGQLVLHPISWRRELAEATRIAGRGADPAKVRQVLARVAPCMHLEHRLGACPLGLRHDVHEEGTHNLVVDVFYEAVLDQVVGQVAPSLNTTYVAAGTSSVATTPDMTQLGAEGYRAVWTDRQKDGATAAVLYFFFGETIANFYHHEFAAFAGDASGTANSGLMVARWLYDFNKDSTMTLNGQYTLGKG